MDADQTVVTVDIYGVQYKLKGHSNVEYIKKVAAAIDESMKKLAKGYPRLDMPKLAVLSAVQIMEEVYRLRRDNTRLLEEEARLNLMIRELEQISEQSVALQAELAETKRMASEQLQKAKAAAEAELAEMLALAAEQAAEQQAAAAEAMKAQEETIIRLTQENVERIAALRTKKDEIRQKLRWRASDGKDSELTELPNQKEAELAALKNEKEAELSELRNQKEAELAELQQAKEISSLSWSLKRKYKYPSLKERVPRSWLL